LPGGAADGLPGPGASEAAPAAAAAQKARSASAGARWLPWLFVVLCAVHLAPVWGVTYLPTTDGPSHLYNAWIIKHIGDAAQPRLAETFGVVWQPLPNWLCYALTWALLSVAPPLIAEKLLVSAVILLWLLGFWYLAGTVERERRWVAFLGFPFVFNLAFQFGFWNFCLSLGFFMLAVGYWWRRRREPDLRPALATNGILLLCYFSHIVSLELALFSIGVLWLCSFERASWRRHLRHVAWLAPQALLPLWFMLSHRGGVMPDPTPARQLLHRLFHFDMLVVFVNARQINDWMALAFACLVVLTVAGRVGGWAASGAGARGAGAPGAGARGAGAPVAGRPGPRRLVRREDAFLLLAVLLALVYLYAPAGMAGGSILKPRLAYYPWLALLPWLSVPLAGTARVAGAVLLAAPGLVNVRQAWQCYRQMDPILTAYVHTLDKVAPGSGVLPLYFDRPDFCIRGGLGVLGHTIDYAAIDKGLIDWDDYEAGLDYFTVRFLPRAAAYRPDTYILEAAPNDLRIRRYLEHSEYIFSFGMPDDAPVRRRILRYYDQIHELGPVRLFARR
jgi:hypothetical protein